jgi:threonine dehydrogenase-like Zn-dependent dehydrogenase
MSDSLQAAEMPKLDAFDEEFGQDPVAVASVRRGKIVRRLVMLAVVVLCAGAIAALAFAWSSADGRLRLELQSIAPSPRTVAREGSEEEIDRLRRRMDELEGEVRELTQARQQADDTIAALQAVEKETHNQPPPIYWYSNPAALNLSIAHQSEPGGVALPSPRPTTPRRDARDARGRQSPPAPQ